jgi:hypothetical protein
MLIPRVPSSVIQADHRCSDDREGKRDHARLRAPSVGGLGQHRRAGVDLGRPAAGPRHRENRHTSRGVVDVDRPNLLIQIPATPASVARAITLVARSEGARVVVAGRDKAEFVAAYDVPDITAEVVDAAPIAALADRVGPVDHVVSTASARTRLPPSPTGWAPSITWCRPPRPEAQESWRSWNARICSCRLTPRSSAPSC